MKTPLKIIGILVGVGFTVIAGAAAAQPATFMIVNYGSGLCLEPNGSGLGAPILQQPCDSTRMTRWVASPATATQYQIANKGIPDVSGRPERRQCRSDRRSTVDLRYTSPLYEMATLYPRSGPFL
jgi:hypothetical protein